jgi:hypothetical protein
MCFRTGHKINALYIKMIGGFLAPAVNAAIEGFSFAHTEPFESQTGVGYAPARTALVALITAAIIFGIILIVGKYLWNNILHELVPAIKPAKSVWQILGIAVLLSLLAPGCNCA